MEVVSFYDFTGEALCDSGRKRGMNATPTTFNIRMRRVGFAVALLFCTQICTILTRCGRL